MKKYSFTEQKDTRSGFGVGLLEVGRNNPNVVGLTADLTGSLKMDAFEKEFPNRFFQVGIAEANMIGIAAGLTIGGKIPFTGTFANFSTGRVYDQIRQSVAYSNKNVKICASHAGLTLGEDGATHQILEDIGMMKMLPNMTVICPSDYNETKAATIAIANHVGPVYLRFGRPAWPVFNTDEPFIIGKPLDVEAILQSVKKTGCVVTAEEHMRNGGLGDSVAQVLAMHHPAPQEYVAVNDTFGESGKPLELLKKYGLDTVDIIAAAQKVMNRK
jgi:transketolase